MVTIELLTSMCPKTRHSILEGFVEPLNTVAEYYEMFENPRRVAGFLAQIAHESGGFNAVVENLNYSAKGLMGTFKKYFPTEDLAKRYERKPEMIANRVYANRMKNGDEYSGDGFRFRGRGLIQLTGRDNYRMAQDALNIPLLQQPELAERPDIAAKIAIWYWQTRVKPHINNFNDTKAVTQKINPAMRGLQDRHSKFMDYKNILL